MAGWRAETYIYMNQHKSSEFNIPFIKKIRKVIRKKSKLNKRKEKNSGEKGENIWMGSPFFYYGLEWK